LILAWSESLPPRNPDTTERIALDEHHIAVTAFNMVFVYWAKETQLLSFQRVCDSLARLASAHSEGVGVCQLVGLQAIPPGSETRTEITRLMTERVGGLLMHYSIVHEGSGFKAASVRAIVSASHMLARTKANLAVFSSLSDASAWHAAQQRVLKRNESPQLISGILRELQDEHQKYARRISESALRR
jgi:hypothetical protein